LDPKDLNKNIRHEHYYSRTVDEIHYKKGKNYFSVVDTTKGYWHVKLDHESSLLCTFNTPFGRYRFQCLPFGIVVSQDILQRKLDDIYLNRFAAKVAELTARILSYYDPDIATTTILQCDTSQKGLGAWIRPTNSNSKERIVTMASRSLTDSEFRHSNIERECLAVMFGLEKFEYYLLGRHTMLKPTTHH